MSAALMGSFFAAPVYAENTVNSVARIPMGDVNTDGFVDVTDLTELALCLLGDTEFSDMQAYLADVDYDGEVTLADLAKMRQFLSKKINTLERYKDINIKNLAAPLYSTARSTADYTSVNEFSAFAADFSDNVLLDTPDQKEGVNRVYSPLSVYMAVSMLAECCDGKSCDELLELLSVSDKDRLRKINHDIFDSLYFDDENAYCLLANSLWVDNEYTCNKDALDSLASNYFTSIFERDLQSQADCDEIGEWISQNTSGKFKPEVLADPDAVLDLINTVTFKESWNEGFDKTTTEGTFKGADGDITCQYMTGSERSSVTETKDYTIWSKKFHDGFVMNFVLPSEEKCVDDILSDSDMMKEIFNVKTRKSKECEVRACIPKFSSASKFEIVDTLKAAGITEVFKAADLSPLLDPLDNPVEGSYYVDKVTHEAVIDVNESGCEAAAYTLIAIKTEAAIDEPYEFRADRPFIYYISDQSGTPLFIGTVSDPTQK